LSRNPAAVQFSGKALACFADAEFDPAGRHNTQPLMEPLGYIPLADY
jgi:hypothetical protein